MTSPRGRVTSTVVLSGVTSAGVLDIDLTENYDVSLRPARAGQHCKEAPMRKWIVTGALALSMTLGVAATASAAPPFESSCEASESGLMTAGNRSSNAPNGGVQQGKAKSSEFSQLNFCNQP